MEEWKEGKRDEENERWKQKKDEHKEGKKNEGIKRDGGKGVKR